MKQKHWELWFLLSILIMYIGFMCCTFENVAPTWAIITLIVGCISMIPCLYIGTKPPIDG